LVHVALQRVEALLDRRRRHRLGGNLLVDAVGEAGPDLRLRPAHAVVPADRGVLRRETGLKRAAALVARLGQLERQMLDARDADRSVTDPACSVAGADLDADLPARVPAAAFVGAPDLPVGALSTVARILDVSPAPFAVASPTARSPPSSTTAAS
jgi:hypothetical protein